MNVYVELLQAIDRTRLTEDLKHWAIDELYYLECNPRDAQYLLSVRAKAALATVKPANTTNSTIAYLLGITDQVPRSEIKRTPTSPPDFDFDTNARDETKSYLVEKYGAEHVTLLGTYQTLKTKGAIKDVCRVLRPEGAPGGFSFDDVNNVTKKFILNPNDFKSELEYFNGNLDNDPSLKKWFDTHKDITSAVLALLGNAKSAGIHAGGIVVSGAEVKAHCPLSFDADEGVYVTQTEMANVEQLGLIKYDFLGLRTLNDLSRCRKLIRDRYGLNYKLSDVPLDEQDIFEEFRLGNTLSVFQFNTPIAVGILTQLSKISDGINTLAMITSLGRRGPMNMGMDRVFVDRVNGKEKVDYLHPLLESILTETYGVIIYQEQVMAICKILGGFTGDEALTVMKAMGKKKRSVLESFEKRFLAACETKRVDTKLAKRIWDLMESFAEYGFNKSHAVAYSAVSYLCMWFKTRYPLEWRSAVLMGADKDDFKLFYANWKDEILKPDINQSRSQYYANAADKIVMPLSTINGIGEKVVPVINSLQPYTSFTDFYSKVHKASNGIKKELDVLKEKIKSSGITDDENPMMIKAAELKATKSTFARAINKETCTSLILSGCFDFLKTSEQHMAVFRKELIKEWVSIKHKLNKPDKKTLQADLEYVESVDKMPRKDFLFEELKLLNFTSFDYFDYFKDLIHGAAEKRFKMPLLTPEEALSKKEGETVVVAGAIESIDFKPTKSGKNKGKEMARITLAHNASKVEITIFPGTLEKDDSHERIIRSLKELHPFIVKGKVNLWNGRFSIIYDAGLLLV
jgi:DNA polymerase III alpha subunit